MEFNTPMDTGFTVYSKSGCSNCTKVKKLLTEKNAPNIIIDCDEYLIEDKENFLLFIKEKANREYKIFPMVFNNGIFIGGFNETQEYFDKLLNFDENNIF
jgi:glutaredoxin